MTITIKIDERKKAGKTFLELIKIFRSQENAIEVLEDESPYNPEFVKKIKLAQAEKGDRIVNPKNIWEGIE
jgi:hypothetical protein